jgi:preprotein translocase subunit SecG
MLLDVLLAAVILVCIALVGVILLQRSEGGALGMSGGGPGAFMSARGTGDLLTKTTQVLAGLFFVLCLLMTLLGGQAHQSAIINSLKINKVDPSTLTPHPLTPPPSSNAPIGLPAPAADTTPSAPPSSDPFAVKPAPGGPATLPAPAR